MASVEPLKYACKTLVLDAGPLLSLSPLRGLAETYVTVPQVLDELRDKRAREHFEQLALTTGVHVKIQSPDAASLAHVIQFAKKTGDYSVLSHPDLCVLALTYALNEQEKKIALVKALAEHLAEFSLSDEGLTDKKSTEHTEGEEISALIDGDRVEGEEAEGDSAGDAIADADLEEREPLDVELQPLQESRDSHTSDKPEKESPTPHSNPQSRSPPPPIYDDPSDDDDGEGEWITPSNVSTHKSRAMGLTPSASAKKGKTKETVPVGCMTADFAMQNVLLQMSLNLIGTEGKKIEKVKTWVLRCHACFKICKDSSKKFCPSCGSPTLMRASVTLSSPTAAQDAPVMQVHLKKNFQYNTRGTIYSIPSPKSGNAKTGSGEGLILREDQTAFMRAEKRADAQRQKDEKKLLSGALANGGKQLNVGNWMDPDWIPDIISAGPSGKGRNVKGHGDLPTIGYGRKNPNERKRHK
ncbi:hypothetical protein FA95DRAFT_1481220 [Auriscalpium vulgare]|uniref:Uncharacterized protein n=1 Tax=Auriscalpium vulgare TaxID=40419 RepID=A0ACB8SBN5_9AGAM|nr:hypothetical protein FA95DRAFT_1481220 [Auriscalpium vulgare]